MPTELGDGVFERAEWLPTLVGLGAWFAGFWLWFEVSGQVALLWFTCWLLVGLLWLARWARRRFGELNDAG